MESVVINKKMLRKNKALKKAQRESKKYFGRMRGDAPKAQINKFVFIKNKRFVPMTEKEHEINFEVPDNLNYETLIEKLRCSKLTGLSGNGFSVAEKIEAFRNCDANENILLVNAVECDPGLIHDEWILEHRLNQVLKSIEILDHIFHFQKKVIAAKVEMTCRNCSIEMKKVPNRYPMGAERILIRNTLHIDIAAEQIPVEHGILVMNIQTVLMLGSIMQGDRFDSRYLTLANLITGDARVVRAYLGDDARTLMQRCMPGNEEKSIYLGGGSMSCHELEKGETITETTNFIAYAQRPEYEFAGKCKGCGACSASCPMKIKVHKIVQSLEKGKTNGLSEYHPETCMQCGACTYVCHAGKDTRKIVQSSIR